MPRTFKDIWSDAIKDIRKKHWSSSQYGLPFLRQLNKSNLNNVYDYIVKGTPMKRKATTVKRRKELRKVRARSDPPQMMSPPPSLNLQYDTPQSVASTAASAAAAAAVSGATVSTLGMDSATSTAALMVGKPVRSARKISSQKMSRYATLAFARKMAWQALLPQFRIRMHTPGVKTFSADSGKQGVFSDTTADYMFPSKTFLHQMLYKSQVDHQPWTHGTTYTARNSTDNGAIYLTANYDSFVTGGETNNNQGAEPNASAISPAANSLFQQQDYNSGMQVKYFKRTYTFMNTGTFPVSLLAYEYVKAHDERLAFASPKAHWENDVLAWQPMYDSNYAYTTNNQVANPRGTITHDITDPGMRPNKRCVNLNDTWRTKKVTAFVLSSGQSCTHTVLVPGFYVSSREVNKNVWEAIPNKTHCMMFILQGSVAFEGAAATVGTIGIGPATLAYRYESEAHIQCIPNNKSFTSYECREDTYALDNQNYALTTPISVVPNFAIRKLEQHENADLATAQTDGAEV